MKTITEIQQEIAEWTAHNFPTSQSWQQLLGCQEELGELSHEYLKKAQKIREHENYKLNARDAIGDLMIYLLNFCNHEGFSVEEVLNETWDEVRKRDWIKNSVSGQKDGTS